MGGIQTSRGVALSVVLMMLAIVSPAFAQSRALSARDARDARRVIRQIDAFADAGVLGLQRIGSNTGTLLRRLDAQGASQSRLQSIERFYARSTSAVRTRQAARIDREYNAMRTRLLALSGSADLIEELDVERFLALSDLDAAEQETLEELSSVLTEVISN
ncbi:MAG: hypothetical protein SFZ24_00255 [Planctomycetota bacterium]|nr:hypothetical protein [Planctomycetota bacterium]